MKKIELTCGQFALVDAPDYFRLRKYKWCAMYDPNIKGYYAVRNSSAKNGKHRRTLRMHRVIMKAKRGDIVDHRDHNTLNNCRNNLRFGNHSLNSLNSKKQSDRLSKYKGVTWNKNKWVSQFNGKYLGRFNSERKAARAYNKAALKYDKNWALINEM